MQFCVPISGEGYDAVGFSGGYPAGGTGEVGAGNGLIQKKTGNLGDNVSVTNSIEKVRRGGGGETDRRFALQSRIQLLRAGAESRLPAHLQHRVRQVVRDGDGVPAPRVHGPGVPPLRGLRVPPGHAVAHLIEGGPVGEPVGHVIVRGLVLGHALRVVQKQLGQLGLECGMLHPEGVLTLGSVLLFPGKLIQGGAHALVGQKVEAQGPACFVKKLHAGVGIPEAGGHSVIVGVAGEQDRLGLSDQIGVCDAGGVIVVLKARRN